MTHTFVKTLIFAGVLTLLMPDYVFAQEVQSTYFTHPFFQSFNRKDFNGSTQNWDFVQDSRGVMYIGNGQGILEYDGQNWRLIELDNNTNARSIDMAGDTTLFVGGINEIGYLAPDSLGLLQYVSLLPHVGEDDREFGEVWFVNAQSEGVYFQTRDYLFRWSGDALTTWYPETRFNTSAVVRDTFYVHAYGKGLYKMVQDSLHFIEGSEAFKEEWVFVMLPFDEHTILLGTRDQGFHLLDNRGFRRFPTDVDEYLLQKTLYLPGAILNDGTIAVGTTDAGLLILDRDGKLLHQIDDQMGLSDNRVYYVYQDQEQGLWLALGNGIVRLEYPSPLSFLNQQAGLPEGILSIAMHGGLIYVGTFEGVFIIDEVAGTVRPLEGATSRVWYFLETPEALYAANPGGILRIEGEEAIVWNLAETSPTNDFLSFSLHRSRLIPDILFVGKRDGLDVLQFDPNDAEAWRLLGSIPGISSEVNSINELEPGTLQVGLGTGVAHLTYTANTLITPEMQTFGEEAGLPVGSIWGYRAAGQFFYGSTDGLFTFDPSTESFTRVDSLFPGVPFNDFSTYGSLIDGVDGDVWITARDGVHHAFPDPDGGFAVESTPFLNAADWTMNRIKVTDEGIAWFAGIDGVVRYDGSVTKPYESTSPPLIHRVQVGADSLIAGGQGAAFMELFADAPVLEHAVNSIRLDYQAPMYDLPERVVYQSKLEGYDKNWSSYSTDTWRTYTNLPAGSYSFQVRSENAYGVASDVTAYSFSVLPPWWQTWWAYLGYGLLIVLSFIGFAHVYRRRAVARERLRAEREKARAIESTNNELQKALKHLTETQDQLIHTEKMASLGQLTAGIAHEIKNPLNFVNNFGVVAREQAEDIETILVQERNRLDAASAHELKALIDDLKTTATKITEHGERADRIIKSMLEHSRTGRGDLKRTDINVLVEEFAHLAYHGMRARQPDFNVDLQINYDSMLERANLYPQEIGRVLINMLDNAFYSVDQKSRTASPSFTPRVFVETRSIPDGVEITIQDNGMGIPGSIKKKIFEPFFTTKPTGSGTGLGLSLSHDIIVQGHNGSLTHEGKEGEGARFVIQLPLDIEDSLVSTA